MTRATLEYCYPDDLMGITVYSEDGEAVVAICHPLEEFAEPDGAVIDYIGDREVRRYPARDWGRSQIIDWAMQEGHEWAARLGYDTRNP